MIRISFFPRYDETGASSRYRIYKCLKYYALGNVRYEVYPLFDKKYFKIRNKFSLSLYVLYRYGMRLKHLLKSRRDDLLYIEKELFPYVPFLESFLLKAFKTKYLLDYDDAIFHDYDLNPGKLIRALLRSKIPNLMQKADYVITGSPYLTQYTEQFTDKVCEIPTSVDLNDYFILDNEREYRYNNEFLIGWIGSKSTSIFVYGIFPALIKFCQKYNAKVILMGYTQGVNDPLPDSVQVMQWDLSAEKVFLNAIDVGIMPLDGSPFTRGKCGFKLIQYMAFSKPTISTPLPANVKINHDNGNLFATSLDEWFNSLEKIYLDRERYKTIGEQNRLLVEKYYSIRNNTPKYFEIFKALAGESKIRIN